MYLLVEGMLLLVLMSILHERTYGQRQQGVLHGVVSDIPELTPLPGISVESISRHGNVSNAVGMQGRGSLGSH